MPPIAPPRIPLNVGLADGDGPHSLQSRLWTVWITLVSILITAWLCTLGWIPAVLALVVEKHVLVAILVSRLGVDQKNELPASET